VPILLRGMISQLVDETLQIEILMLLELNLILFIELMDIKIGKNYTIILDLD
jgi:hypothetical protein